MQFFTDRFKQFEITESKTRDFLDQNPEIQKGISQYFEAYRYLSCLIPQTTENWASGHFFPFKESEYELENSFCLVCIGYYRYSFIALRTSLELALLSVFWDRGGKSHIEIKDWVHAKRDTPFKKQILEGLFQIDNVKAFNLKVDFKKRINDVYGELSNYIHVKGYRYSSTGQTSLKLPIITFSKSAFLTWFDLMGKVLEISCIVHILKYPIALQDIPLDEKFGLNPPLGSFLAPWQADHIRSLLDTSVLTELQTISDDDQDTKKIVEEIKNLPDISEEQFDEQLLEWDKFMIEGQGFQSWFENQRNTFNYLAPEDQNQYQKFLERAKQLEIWSKENNLLETNKLGLKPKR